MSIKTLVYCSLYGAIAFVATSFLQIKITFGYIHLGDIVFFLLLRLVFKKDKNLIYCLITYAFFMGVSDLYLGYPNYLLTTISTRLLLVIVYYSTNKLSIIRSFSWLFIPINYFFTDMLLFDKSFAISFLLFNFLQIMIPLFLQSSFLISYFLQRISKKVRMKKTMIKRNESSFVSLSVK